MSVKVDGKRVLEKVKAGEPDRKKVSLYLSETLYDQFVDRCKAEETSASRVMEELMQGFLESLPRKTR